MKITCHMRSGHSHHMGMIGLRIPATPTELDVTEEQARLIKADARIAVYEGAGPPKAESRPAAQASPAPSPKSEPSSAEDRPKRRRRFGSKQDL